MRDPPLLTLANDGAVDVIVTYTEGQAELILAPDLQITGKKLFFFTLCKVSEMYTHFCYEKMYRIAGKFGGIFNLAVWLSRKKTTN